MTATQPPPPLVFKYVGFEKHHLEILQKLHIRFTQPDDLNDPFDAMPGIAQPSNLDAFVDDVIARNLPSVQAIQGKLPQARKAAIQRYKTNPKALVAAGFQRVRQVINGAGILSLSSTNDNLVMWAHYASGHRGFVVGLRPNAPPLIKRVGDIGGEGELRPVQYVADRLVIPMDSIDLPSNFFFTKGALWSYEQEWRVVRRLAHCDNVVANRIYLCSLHPDAVARVDVGEMADAATLDAIRAATGPGTPLAHVEVYQGRMDSGRTALEFERLN